MSSVNLVRGTNMELVRTIGRRLKALHRDEQGADLVEYILIVAAIALPLLGVVIYYRDDISEWISGTYEEVRSGEGSQNPDDF
jgi:Flp pilus assembly pilin Flp